MSESTYKGDSPGKALVRFKAWAAIRSVCQKMNIPFQGALVLAGEGGDLGVLHGLGMDLSKVVAVDRDPFMVEWCQHNYPGVQGYVGDITTATGQPSVPYNTAHIDLCGGLRKADNILATAHTAMRVHTHPAVIAVTMLKGREGKAGTHLMEGTRRNHRRQLLRKAAKKGNALGQLVYSTEKWDSLKALAIMKGRMREEIRRKPEIEGWLNPKGDFTAFGSAIARATIMHHAVEHIWEAWEIDAKIGLPAGEVLQMHQIGIMAYHSGTDDDRGLPFVTALYLIYRSSQEHMAHYLVDSQIHNSQTGGPVMLPYSCLDLQTGMEALKPTIASLGRVMPHDRVASIFGIDPKSIPPIIAHDTRGSYNGRSLGQLCKTGNEVSADRGWGDLEELVSGSM